MGLLRNLKRRLEKRKLRKIIVYEVEAYVDVSSEQTVSLVVMARNEKELFERLSTGGYYPPFVVTGMKSLSDEMYEEVIG